MLDSDRTEGISSMLRDCICWISAWLNASVGVVNKFAQFIIRALNVLPRSNTDAPPAIKKQLVDKLAAFLSASSKEVLG